MITRRSFLGTAAILTLSQVAFAKPKKKRGRPEPVPVYHPGDRAVFRCHDEPRNNAPAFKLGAVGQDFIVFPDMETGPYFAYAEAIRLGDQAAYDDLMARGGLVKLPAGTPVLVLGEVTDLPSCYNLRSFPGGYYNCRVQDSPHRGKKLAIPARNLDPAI